MAVFKGEKKIADSMPSTENLADGDYMLVCSIENGVAHYHWMGFSLSNRASSTTEEE